MVATVVIVGVLAGAAVRSSGLIIRDAERMRFADRRELVDSHMVLIENVLEGTVGFLASAVRSAPLTATPGSPVDRAFAERILTSVPGHYDSVSVLDATGTVTTTAGFDNNTAPPATDPGYGVLREQLAAGRIAVSPVMNGSRPTIGYGAPIRQGDRVVGSVVLFFNVFGKYSINALVRSFADEPDKGSAGGLIVFDRNLTLVASHRDGAVGTQLADVPAHRTAAAGARAGRETFDEGGTRQVLIYSPVGNSGYTIAFKQDAGAFYGRIRAEHQRSNVLLFGVIAVLGAAVGLLLARRHQIVQRNEAELAALFRSAADVVSVVRDGRTVFCSAGIERLSGRLVDPATLPARPEDRRTYDELLATAQKWPGVDASAEFLVEHVDGGTRWVDATAVDLTEDPSVRGLVLTLHDVTERKELEAEVQHRALHDPLTGLANRSLFNDRVDLAMKRLARRDDIVALMFLDLDRFKPVNDELGHAAGDRVLREIAARLGAAVRPNDTVARLGGDEFAVLVEDLAEHSAAVDLAERLCEVVRRPIDLPGGPVSVGVSIGVAFAQGKGSDGATLLHNADLAMYSAKERGTGSVEQFGFHLGTEDRSAR